MDPTKPITVSLFDQISGQAGEIDPYGRLSVVLARREDIVYGDATLTNTTETTLIAATAGVFHDLATIVVINASGTITNVQFRDDTGGTVRFTIPVAADGGGAVIPFPYPLPQTALNDNWTVQLSTGVSSVFCLGVALIRGT